MTLIDLSVICVVGYVAFLLSLMLHNKNKCNSCSYYKQQLERKKDESAIRNELYIRYFKANLASNRGIAKLKRKIYRLEGMEPKLCKAITGCKSKDRLLRSGLYKPHWQLAGMKYRHGRFLPLKPVSRKS